MVARGRGEEGRRALLLTVLIVAPLFVAENIRLQGWSLFLDRLGDLTLEDVLPNGYMASLITQSMLLNLGLAGRLSKWTPLFDSFWPHGLPSAAI